MQILLPIRSFAAVLALASTLPLQAQMQAAKPSAAVPAPSTLPATQPTTTPPPTPAQLPPGHPQITYSSGMLSVTANNSSLNQILREISRETGIKITGGVADERVFGHYGPDAPAQILATLLDGTGSNMLIVHRDGDTPAELILTPRVGGVTPPNPNAAVFDERDTSENQPPQSEDPHPASAREGFVPATPPTSTSALGAPANNTPANSPANSNDQQSPNGVKTPQQIYDQLQRMRAQQQPQTPQ